VEIQREKERMTECISAGARAREREGEEEEDRERERARKATQESNAPFMLTLLA
jgi:hypothetical protein